MRRHIIEAVVMFAGAYTFAFAVFAMFFGVGAISVALASSTFALAGVGVAISEDVRRRFG